MKRRSLAFSRADLRTWRADMSRMQPAQRPSGPLMQMLNVASMAVGATPTGLILRLTSARGEVADVFVNPAVAEAMLAALRAAGQSEGWLGKDDRVIEPSPDP